MTHLEQVLHAVRPQWESEWTPFSDTEWADLCSMMAVAIGDNFTLLIRGVKRPAPTTTGNAIRYARAAAGMTQLDLGIAVGVSCSTVCYWEQGKRMPTRDNIRDLREVLGESIPMAGCHCEAL